MFPSSKKREEGLFLSGLSTAADSGCSAARLGRGDLSPLWELTRCHGRCLHLSLPPQESARPLGTQAWHCGCQRLGLGLPGIPCGWPAGTHHLSLSGAHSCSRLRGTRGAAAWAWAPAQSPHLPAPVVVCFSRVWRESFDGAARVPGSVSSIRLVSSHL